jgi:hypothetical protein
VSRSLSSIAQQLRETGREADDVRRQLDEATLLVAALDHRKWDLEKRFRDLRDELAQRALEES